jgi:phage shock protein A
MSTDRPGFFARMFGLLRGTMTGWMRDREQQNPRAVYENAIAERVRQYRELKEAVAGILYMRNKIEGELTERRTELASTLEDIRRAIRKGDDEAGLALVKRKQALMADLEHAERELQSVRSEADEAKGNLVRFRDEIRQLEREKSRMLATMANSKARRRIQEAFQGLSVDADMRALEGVREYVAKMSTAGHLDRELGADEGLDLRLKTIREEAQTDAAERELAELKRQMGPAEIAPESGAGTVDTTATPAKSMGSPAAVSS